MTSSKEKYIDLNILNLLHAWTSAATLIGTFVIVALSVLDYFVTPENFMTFFLYRVGAAVAIFACYLINKIKINTTLHHSITISASVIVSAMVSLMIAKFGGHHSPYFAGIILTVVFVVGLAPLNITMCVVASLVIYGIYLIPILLYDTITDKAFFLTANAFIISVITATIILRFLIHQRFVSEFSLQYDLDQQKKQLEVYSHHLEELVQERTKDLRKSEQWHKSIVDNANDGIIILNKDGMVININDKACEMHGFPREALLGTHIRLLENSTRPDELADRMRRLLSGEALVFESMHHKKDGTPLYLEISSKVITIAGEVFIQSLYRDITEKKKLQEHIFQSQKMESIGVLAGGIAHDFNNVLTAILGHTEIIRRGSADENSVRSLNVIEDASRRAGRMISKLLGFARKSNYEVVPLNVNDVIFDTVKLLERVIDRKINLSVELDNHLPLVGGDVSQMEQIIMNLIVNARDAMPKGGRIVIKTTARQVVKGMPDIPPYIQPGEYVLLSVSDTGIGIPREIVSRIYEPFFTTKEPGKGTGLGLSMVYGAVKEHNGYISVQSEQHKGTAFTIYIPAAQAPVQKREKKQVQAISGSETVLVVDDEQDILQAMQDALTNHGYKVFAISDPESAISIFKKLSNEIDLVITDIVMPKTNGKELVGQIKKINPDVKIIAISGYTRYVAPKDEIGEINGFLQKPFESYYLLSVVRRILDARPLDTLRN